MTGTELLVDELFLRRLRKEAARRIYHSVSHDDRAVMQRGIREEYISEKLLAGYGIKDRAGLDLLTELCLALYDYERAGGGTGELLTGEGYLLYRAVLPSLLLGYGGIKEEDRLCDLGASDLFESTS